MLQENNFRPSSYVFNRVKEDLSSFDDSGIIDEGRFYTDVKWVLSRLGVSWFITKEKFIKVHNYKAELPRDFKLLDYAFRCTGEECGQYGTLPKHRLVVEEQTFDHYPMLENDWHDTRCVDKCCTPPKDCIFNAHRSLYVQTGDTYYKYSDPVLLKLGNVNTKRFCTDSCMNVFSTSSDTITIQNNFLYTNFESGHIYVMYHTFPVDEESGLPLIPDNPIIEKCIEDYIKYNAIKSAATNKKADVANLISLYRQDHKESWADAVYETKLPTFDNMVKQVRKMRNSLNIYFQM